ncbi:MAG: hypothetical protein FWC45_08100 [Treponema sp.]|nr:hypothetical protein [Treponema sp.]
MMKKTIHLITALVFTLVLFSGCSQSDKPIVVGAKDYTEQDVLGNILLVLFKKNTDLNIRYKHEMASNVIFEAVKSGDVDVYIDYTGTIYGNYLNYSDMKTAVEVYDIAAREMAEKYRLKVLQPLGFNNTYCLAVRPDTAQQYNLKTYSDLARVSSNFIFGGSFEILNRNDGLPNLKKAYNMSFKTEMAVEGVLRYTSLKNDETQVTEAFSTDGMLLDYNLVVLEDDKNFFPPYQAVPVMRMPTAEKYPVILEQLNRLSGLLNNDTMRELNYKVDVLKHDPLDVAREFLLRQDL